MPFMRSIWLCRFCWASASITGPISVVNSTGLPTRNSFIAPLIMVIKWSAMSSCKHKMRNAEQRCPAESNAEFKTSAHTCSGKAVLSTIMAFCPPVSAIKTGVSLRLARFWLIKRATSVEPVKITPLMRSSCVSAAPTSPAPNTSCNTSTGTPA